ncbi:hypothetical protein PSJ8397_01533 [Pseudooctadecabacter jejudonensis]|uniref:Uncharacterized protein n=1 Tax=Pseudooctadecabacter jejudonensis TaxID=1391910 RepID=A0A1Y5S4D4_9RHOB|nr:hypothetical protein PSJ8397_01533 [Pseudooctadecabacter jejudonensis]
MMMICDQVLRTAESKNSQNFCASGGHIFETAKRGDLPLRRVL